MIVRARLVCPIASAPIENGFVEIHQGQIARVGRWNSLSSADVDLGEAALFPGLINVHCHLEYSNWAGQLPPGLPFVDWIDRMIALKQEFQPAGADSAGLDGCRQLLKYGVTSLIDSVSGPELLERRADWRTSLRIRHCLESTGVLAHRPAPELIEEASDCFQRLQKSGLDLGLAPHAPYSTPDGFYASAADLARRDGVGFSTHLAESEEEWLWMTREEGALTSWLNRHSTKRPPLRSPVDFLENQNALVEGMTAAHVNWFTPDDLELLACRGVNVAHCPGTHRYFHRPPFALDPFEGADVNVCLATDSLATAPIASGGAELNLFHEARMFLEDHPSVSPVAAMEMITERPARALGKAGSLGILKTGAEADMAAAPVSCAVAGKWYWAEELIYRHQPASWLMINGIPIDPT